MKTIYCITGANGHLGNVLVQKLCLLGHQVRALMLPGDQSHLAPCPQLTIYQGDICEQDTLTAFFDCPPDSELVVIHAAGIVSIASKVQRNVYDVNVNGTKNIIAMCLAHRVRRLVHVSSVHALKEQRQGCWIYEQTKFDPVHVVGAYAKTKAEATQAVLDSVEQGLDAVIVHPSGILGPFDYGHGHLTQMVEDYLNGRLKACVRGGYDFVDVRDVADGIIAAAEKGKKGACYILSNHYMPVEDLLYLVHKVSGKRPIRIVLPMWFAKGTAGLSELYYKLLHQKPLYTSYSLYTLTSNGLFCHDKATEELGYQPRPLIETVEDTATFLYAEGRIHDKKHRLTLKQPAHLQSMLP